MGLSHTSSLIDIVKLIRSFCGMGLRESKILAVAWENAYGNDFVIEDMKQLYKLGSMCRMVTSGEWVINSNDEIIIQKPIEASDIFNLTP